MLFLQPVVTLQGALTNGPVYPKTLSEHQQRWAHKVPEHRFYFHTTPPRLLSPVIPYTHPFWPLYVPSTRSLLGELGPRMKLVTGILCSYVGSEDTQRSQLVWSQLMESSQPLWSGWWRFILKHSSTFIIVLLQNTVQYATVSFTYVTILLLCMVWSRWLAVDI